MTPYKYKAICQIFATYSRVNSVCNLHDASKCAYKIHLCACYQNSLPKNIFENNILIYFAAPITELS